jgi:hypothetical protein
MSRAFRLTLVLVLMLSVGVGVRLVGVGQDHPTTREIEMFGSDASLPVCTDEGLPQGDVDPDEIPPDAVVDEEPVCHASTENVTEVPCGPSLTPARACPGGPPLDN